MAIPRMTSLQITLVLVLCVSFMASQTTGSCITDKDCQQGMFCAGLSNVDTPLVKDTFQFNTGENRQSQFDNVTDAYRVPDNDMPQLGQKITIFAKVKQRKNNNGYVVAKGVNWNDRNYGLYLRNEKKQVWFIFKNDSGESPTVQKWKAVIFLDVDIADDNWHTVAVSFDHTAQRVELYVDGRLNFAMEESSTPMFDHNPTQTAQLWVGGRPPTKERNFHGDIEIVRIYSIALTEAQVRQTHNEAMSGQNGTCTAYLKLNQTCSIRNCGPKEITCQSRCERNLACYAKPQHMEDIIAIPHGESPLKLEGICRKPCTKCLEGSQQVCGNDGVTYSCRNNAECAGVTDVVDGKCPSRTELLNMYLTLNAQ